MYCPSCGASATPGLNYCKSCGQSLQGAEMPAAPGIHPLALTVMFLSVVAIAIVGFIAVFASSVELINRGIDSNRVIPLVFALAGFGSFMVVTVVALLLKFLSNVLGLPRRSRLAERLARPVTGRLDTGQLPAPPGSVTEHTTRNFDPAARHEAQRDR